MKFEKACDTAARLHVTVRAVQKWAKEGKIPMRTRWEEIGIFP